MERADHGSRCRARRCRGHLCHPQPHHCGRRLYRAGHAILRRRGALVHRTLSSRGIFHLAVDDDRVVGFQNVEPFASYTHAFDHVGIIGTYVDLELRRRGIASRLFAATFEAAQRKGYEKLFAFVRSDNPVALQTYLRHGFETIGTARRQARINGRYVDEVLIEAWIENARSSRPAR